MSESLIPINVLKKVRMPGGRFTVIVQGRERAEARSWRVEGGALRARVVVRRRAPPERSTELLRELRALGWERLRRVTRLPGEGELAIEDPAVLADILATNLADREDTQKLKQSLLEEHDAERRVQRLVAHLTVVVMQKQRRPPIGHPDIQDGLGLGRHARPDAEGLKDGPRPRGDGGGSAIELGRDQPVRRCGFHQRHRHAGLSQGATKGQTRHAAANDEDVGRQSGR